MLPGPRADEQFTDSARAFYILLSLALTTTQAQAQAPAYNGSEDAHYTSMRTYMFVCLLDTVRQDGGSYAYGGLFCLLLLAFVVMLLLCSASLPCACVYVV